MTLSIDSLQLSNFRCFKEAALDLHPRLTVIVADNGMGKTAILDALATGMAEFVDALLDDQHSPGILPGDVRASVDGKEPAQLTLKANCGGKEMNWSLRRKTASSPMRRGPRQLVEVREAANTLKKECKGPGSTLPLFTYYQSTRFAQSTFFDQKYPGMKKRPEGRYDGFADYLTPLSNAAHFNEWYAARWRAVAKSTAPGAGPGGEALAELSSVRNAVRTVLEPTGWSEIDWDDKAERVVVEHADRGRLPLSWLSSGIRSMVALSADMALRCASLNPHMGEDAASRTPGVVLIDEVDLHLHPSWQQRVVDLLQSAFAELQLVLTTHSPQVLSTVHAESVRIVKHHADESYINTPEFQTRGVESADVLAQIMGVDPIPQVSEARDLQRFRAMIEDGTSASDAGVDLRQRLLAHFGESHPLMLDCTRLERFVAFKHRRKQEGGGDAQA